jgi:Tol biopolymer transport system component
MRTRRFSPASLLCISLLALAACGSGGGSGGSGRFPDSAPTDLVAIVADLDDDGEELYQLIVSDVEGRGHVVFTDFVDPINNGVLDEGVVWSPDHTRLAYLARPDGGDLPHVFVLEPQFGQPLDIIGTEIEASQLDTSFSTLAWSPDGTRLSFSVSDGDSVGRILLVNPDGSDLVDLFPLCPAGSEDMKGRAVWAPDSSRVAVRVELAGTAGERVFTFRPDGTDFADVTASPAPVEDALVNEVLWNAQSTRLLIRGALEEENFTDVYVARPVANSSYFRVSPHTGGGDVIHAAWSPDGSRIAYLANLEGPVEAFTVASNGTGNVKVSGSMVAGGSVTQAFWAPDGSRLAFLSDRLTDEKFELFTVEPTGANLLTVSLPLVADGGVAIPIDEQGDNETPWSPDSTRLAYLADAVVDGTYDAHIVNAGGGDARPLTAAAAGCEIQVLRWSPDGTHLLLRGELTAVDLVNVFVIDALVPTPPLQVSFATVVGASARSHDWSADGAYVTFEERASSAPGSATLGRSCPRGVLDVRDLADPVEDLQVLVTR